MNPGGTCQNRKSIRLILYQHISAGYDKVTSCLHFASRIQNVDSKLTPNTDQYDKLESHKSLPHQEESDQLSAGKPRGQEVKSITYLYGDKQKLSLVCSIQHHAIVIG